MHGPRVSLFAAILSAGALLAGSASSLLVGASWPEISLGHVVEMATAVVASGFLFFVRRWIARQEEADRKVMDTIREATEHQQRFEREVSEFMGLIRGHLGLHRADSDPSLLITDDRRTMPERRREQR